jgi:hypothetical protein
VTSCGHSVDIDRLRNKATEFSCREDKTGGWTKLVSTRFFACFSFSKEVKLRDICMLTRKIMVFFYIIHRNIFI